MRLIDADALKEYFFRPYSNEEVYSNVDIEEIIDNAPTVEQNAIDEWKNDFKEYINAIDIPRDDYKVIVEYIDEAPTVEQSRWIPVSKRLPEKSGYYLCTMTEEHAQHPTGLEICEYDEDIEEFGFWYERFDKTSLGSLGSEWVELYVLAWTTLPDAYKAESEE